MKRLIVCCDGTWNKLGLYPTNVVKMAQIVKPVAKDGISQVVFYQEGLGTKWYDRLPGGAFGWGIDYNIQSAYQFLCFNYDPGDEIYLFGFSRGAYTARSLAGMMYCSGLLRCTYADWVPEAYRIYRDRSIGPRSKAAVEFRQQYCVHYKGETQVPVTVLGCWDTVGSLGVPDLFPLLPLDRLFNARYDFHDKELNRMILHALHAVAIDERRKVFNVTPMEHSSKAPLQTLRQVWFPGGHGCVGGGTEANCKLSDATLLWMIEEIDRLGLGLDVDLSQLKDQIVLDPLIDFDTSSGLFGKLTAFAPKIDRPIAGDISVLHTHVKKRWQGRTDYRPANLLRFKTELDVG